MKYIIIEIFQKYFNKSLFERFPEIESFKKINMTYKPRTILLDLTKVIIRGNLTNITFENPHFINNITSKGSNQFFSLLFK